MLHLLLSPAYLILGVWALYTLLYFGVYIKGLLARNSIRRDLFALDVSDFDKVAAWEDIKRAFKSDRKTLWYDYSAPFVVPFALVGLEETATRLPKWASGYNNNVSINGDAGVVKRDGKWLTLRNGNEAAAGEQVYTYDDIEFDGYAYYKFFGMKVKPRSFLGRYAFIGIRNRASAMSQELGEEVIEYPQIISGARNLSQSHEGHFLLRSGNVYHYKTAKVIRIAGMKFMRFQSVGHKLEIAMMHASGWGKAAAVAIGWTIKGYEKPE